MTWTQRFGGRATDGCTHEQAQTHRVAGLGRTLCPQCGHIAFDIRDLEDRELDRTVFSRRADSTAVET